jgi:hypothetical protein
MKDPTFKLNCDWLIRSDTCDECGCTFVAWDNPFARWSSTFNYNSSMISPRLYLPWQSWHDSIVYEKILFIEMAT